MGRVGQVRPAQKRLGRHDRGELGRVDAEFKSDADLDAPRVGHLDHAAHEGLGPVVGILLIAGEHGAWRAERLRAGREFEQLPGAKSKL
jgi:hypothetical protein